MDDKLTHFDGQGNAIMVDVTDKEITEREAVAKGSIKVNHTVLDYIKNGEVKKGDVLAVARIAGIMATKRTSDLIPMCHPLMLTNSIIDFEIDEADSQITVSCTVKLAGKTGVEMEALTGATVSLLTIYDMCKAIDKSMEITSVYLAEKTGGKSGKFINP
ncbi:MAG: cyclic pyranopterin monophosphate synthase MoaC [Anaerocolumna sp.]